MPLPARSGLADRMPPSRRFGLRQLVALVAFLGLAPASSAQVVEADLVVRPAVPSENLQFGASVTKTDLDPGDRGFAVGAPGFGGYGAVTIYGYDAGTAAVTPYLEIDPGDPMYSTFIPSTAGMRFGEVVRDMEVFGEPYLLVSAPGQSVTTSGGTTLTGAGEVYRFYVLDGDGPTIFTAPSPRANADFGRAVAVVPDVTGDGTDDIVISAKSDGTVSGSFVGLFNGRTGAFVRAFTDPLGYSTFGTSLAGIHDVDGDGLGDVVIGGSLWVGLYSGATGSYINELPNSYDATYIAASGDHDGDGTEDVWVCRDLNSNFGEVVVSPTGASSTPTGLGLGLNGHCRGLADAGDVDGDGYPDVAIYRYSPSARSYDLFVYSVHGNPNLIARPQRTLVDGSGEVAGSLGTVGDLDGSGTTDLFVGVPYAAVPPEPIETGGVLITFVDQVETTLVAPEGWRIGSFSLTGATLGTVLAPLWMQGIPSSDRDWGTPTLYTYDESLANGAGWTLPSSMSDGVATGRGFAYFAFEDDDLETPGIQGGFPTSLLARGFGPNGAVTLPLTFTDTGDLADDGWNLVGNPFSGAIDWGSEAWDRRWIDDVVYTYDAASQSYQTWNGFTGTAPDGWIAPMEGFWVKGYNPGGRAPHLAVHPEAQAPTPAAATAPSLVLEARGTVASAERTGRAAVMVHPDALDGHDPLDAYALAPLASSYVAVHTLDAGGAQLDINALPPSDAPIAVPLDVWAVADGDLASANVTLRWPDLGALPDDWGAALLDTQTGITTDLRQLDAYTFATGSESRTAGDAPPTPAVGPPTPRPLASSTIASSTTASSTTASSTTARFELRLTAPTAVDDESGPTLRTGIERVQPNPLTGRGAFVVHAGESVDARLSLFDALGREVAVLHDGPIAAGRHEIALDARGLAPGSYVVRWQSGAVAEARTITVLR